MECQATSEAHFFAEKHVGLQSGPYKIICSTFLVKFTREC
jgi:hypothetical protein